ncbi:SgcJ/EcaC family oxidoreductase [Micromonospora coriariae]|nr:SgcJ/EcaC family oxidoreductase [Micromonospora coriariae]
MNHFAGSAGIVARQSSGSPAGPTSAVVQPHCGAHLMIPTKGNQPTLFAQLKSLPWPDVPLGDRRRDRESMALAFEGPLKGSSTYNKQPSLRFVGRDAAIVVSESGILFAGETEVPDTAKVNATWVLEKRDGQWLIAAYHNSPALTPGQ